MKGKKPIIGFRYAWSGIIVTAKIERNFKIHLICGLLAILTGFYLGLSLLEWAILTLVISAVLAAELINTAVENVIDYLKPEPHPSAKYIKDAAAGAVLITAIAAVVIGCLLFVPKIMDLL